MYHPSSTPRSRQDQYATRQHYQGTLADLLRSSPPPRYTGDNNAMDHTGRKRSDTSCVRPRGSPRMYAEADRAHGAAKYPSDFTGPQHTRPVKIHKSDLRQHSSAPVPNAKDIPVAAPVPRLVGNFLNVYHDIPPTPPPIGAFGSEPAKWEELKRKKAEISLRVQAEGTLIQKAEDIKNSAIYPTPHQHHVLRYVYHIITPCPTKTWLAHISITINWYKTSMFSMLYYRC